MRVSQIGCAQVAVVIFSSGFWDSTSCTEELKKFVELVSDQRIGYLPVFMYSTSKEVYRAALHHAGEKFAMQVSSYLLCTLNKDVQPIELRSEVSLQLIHLKLQPCCGRFASPLPCATRARG